MPAVPTIAIVDDDPAIREALEDLVHSYGYGSALFASAEELLGFDRRDTIGCMIVDIAMPGLSGLDLQDELHRSGWKTPVIFLTSHRDAHTREAAIRGGAFAYLTKPAAFQQVIDAIEQALAGH
ncbi:response regulator transcription factor [Rhizobium sp. SL86]|uniref:response regulator transcription factor n=1 Tax=Rhizobium sp. SL86 TaxID=2995148 RepID=UPI002273B2FB|nr:response regulator [Rhizobium sp. SL86]MCY1666919.1 response regulator [Rhizobium sp. SL86]